MSTITIEIKAPELAHALETLAIAIGCTVDKLNMKSIIKEAANETPPVTVSDILTYGGTQETNQQQIQIQNNPVVQQSPIQNVPVQNIPVQQVPIQQQPPIQQPAPVQQPVQQTVPTQTQSYTMDQLAIAATQLMDAGKRNELIGLLGQFGVQALTALPKEQYGAFATALRGMGAKI